MTLREDAQIIMDKALAASLPDAAVEKPLRTKIWQRPDCRRFHWESCLADGKDDGCSFGGPHFRRHCHYQIPARQRGVAAP